MSLAARKDAIQKAKAFTKRKPLFLDTETTGTGPNDNILEISIIDFEGHTLLDTLIRPIGTISPDALKIHGLTEDMTRDAPRWADVWEEIDGILSRQLIGIYNADFDLRMMRQSHTLNWMQWQMPAGMEIFCVMKLYAQFYGRWNPRRGSFYWQSLDAAGRQCGISLPNTHRARDDSLLTRAILLHMAAQDE
jgi:DNA polymerase-3 subunit epsilon